MKRSLILLTVVSLLMLAATAGATEIDFWAMTNAPSDQHYAWMNEKLLNLKRKPV